MVSRSGSGLRERIFGMDLGNPKNTIEVIQKYNFAFQKKFGQNFLIDTHVLDKIISAAGMTKEDTDGNRSLLALLRAQTADVVFSAISGIRVPQQSNHHGAKENEYE